MRGEPAGSATAGWCFDARKRVEMVRRFGLLALFAFVLVAACADAGDSGGEVARGSAESAAAAGSVAAVARTDQGIRRIRAEEVLRTMDTEPGPVVLDVRSPEEYKASHIPGAINIPYDRVSERLDDLRQFQDRDIVLVCRTGRRAAIAGQVLREAGFERLWDLDGHMTGWAAADLPLEGRGECC